MATLLVVDDHEQNRYLLRALLEGHGHTVVEASDGREALERARESAPDCVVTDLLMPVMDGFTLCREWARDERLRDIPIVVYTATYTDPADEQLALRLGARRFLRKPVEPEVLVETLDEVLRTAGDERAQPPPSGVREADELRVYSERLVYKLERKMLQLEQTKQALERQVTEQQHTAAVLAESERQARFLIERLSEGVQRIDTQGRIVFTNPRMEQLLGYGPGELIGRSVFELMDEPSQELVRAALAKDLDGGQGPRLDLVLLRKDFGRVDVWMSGVPIRDERGSLEGHLTLIADIGERKRTEQLLKVRLRLWEHAAEHSLAELLRATLDEVEALTGSVAGYFHLMAPDERSLALPAWSTRTVEEFGEVRGDGMREPMEQAGRWLDCVRQRRTVVHNVDPAMPPQPARPAGDVSLVRELAVPIFRDGKLVAILGLGNKPSNYTDDDLKTVEFLADVAWSIVESRRSADLVQQQLDELSSYYDAAPIGLAVLDLDLRYVRINHVLAAIHGLPAADHVGRAVGEVVPRLAARAKEVTSEILRTGQAQTQLEFTGETIRGPGDTRTFLEGWHPMRDPSGAIQAFMVVVEDITEAQQLRVQIAQSDRLATMGMLAAGVAHEINNPLAYVLFNLESLSEDLPKVFEVLRRCMEVAQVRLGDESWAGLWGSERELVSPAAVDDLCDRFAQALEGSRRIRDIVRNLGTFSRPQEDGLAPVSLAQPIEAAANMASNEIKHRARLVKDYGEVQPILASDGRLAQVFLNLLINAAHAIPEGAVQDHEIRVRTWQCGAEVFAEVHDTGHGISPEHLPHLFEPFFTTKTAGRGTGLGLAISKGIVEGYGGTLAVSSELGKGTSFVLRFSACEPEASQDPGLASEAEKQRLTRGRILIIDDEPAVRKVMARMLGQEHEVVQADSGRQAMAVLEQDTGFDVILCDLMMPDVSGIEFHAWLCERDAALARRLVFVTGGVVSERANEYLSQAANLKLEKPFDTARVKRLIGQLVLAARSEEQTKPSDERRSGREEVE